MIITCYFDTERGLFVIRHGGNQYTRQDHAAAAALVAGFIQDLPARERALA